MPWRGRMLMVVAALLAISGCAGERYHREGLDLIAAGKSEEGLRDLERALKEEPGNVVFKIDLLTRRAEQIARLLDAGDSQRAVGKFDEAEASYQRVLRIEPNNRRANEGLQATARERRHVTTLDLARDMEKVGDLDRALDKVKAILASSPLNQEAQAMRWRLEEQLQKARANDTQSYSNQRKPVTLEFRDASLRIVLDALTRTTGVNFVLDKDVRPDLRTSVFLHQAPLSDAIELILQTNHLEMKVLNRTSILLYVNTPDKQKEYQELTVKGFYLANADVKQTKEMLKGLLKAKDIFIDEKLNLLVMRDTPDAVRLAAKLIAMQDLYEPEVMLDVEVLEVKRSRLTELGVQLPTQLTFAPIVANTVATLDDLRHLNGSRISTTLPSATINLRNEIGDAKILANPRIRARNREKAKIMIGDKVPVVSITTTATGVSSESTQYLDVGIKLEVEPNVYLHDDVAIKIGLEVSSLVREIRTPAGSLAYQIGSRSASTVLRLRDGETQVLAGLIDDEDRSSANRVPGLGAIPMLGRLFSTQKDDREKTEVVLSITPHLIRNIEMPDPGDSEFLSGTESILRAKELTPQLDRPAVEDGKTVKAGDGSTAGNDSAAIQAPTFMSLAWQGPNEVKVGDQFKVALRLKSDGGVRSLPLQLAYDPLVFQIVDVAEGGYFKQRQAKTSMSSNVDAGAGKVFVSVVRSGADGAHGEDNVAVLTLRALASNPKSELKLLMSAPVSIGEKALVPPPPPPFAIKVND